MVPVAGSLKWLVFWLLCCGLLAFLLCILPVLQRLPSIQQMKYRQQMRIGFEVSKRGLYCIVHRQWEVDDSLSRRERRERRKQGVEESSSRSQYQREVNTECRGPFDSELFMAVLYPQFIASCRF